MWAQETTMGLALVNPRTRPSGIGRMRISNRFLSTEESAHHSGANRAQRGSGFEEGQQFSVDLISVCRAQAMGSAWDHFQRRILYDLGGEIR